MVSSYVFSFYKFRFNGSLASFRGGNYPSPVCSSTAHSFSFTCGSEGYYGSSFTDVSMFSSFVWSFRVSFGGLQGWRVSFSIEGSLLLDVLLVSIMFLSGQEFSLSSGS